MDVLPWITDEQGWGQEAAFRELCAVPRLPRGKPVCSTVAGGRRAAMSHSTGEPGASCHRMAKENSRTLSTACRCVEQGATVMEDRKWWTLWNQHPHPALHPSAWKTCLQEWSVKTLNDQTSQAWSKEKRKGKARATEKMEKIKSWDGKDQVLS